LAVRASTFDLLAFSSAMSLPITTHSLMSGTLTAYL
jgi:hypothetical protein